MTESGFRPINEMHSALGNAQAWRVSRLVDTWFGERPKRMMKFKSDVFLLNWQRVFRSAVPLLCFVVLLPCASIAQSQPTPRDQPQSAVVISRTGGETVRFASEGQFRELLVGQILVDGDVVRTGSTGAVALLFVDRTAMRLHPNTELSIRQVSNAQSSLELTSGKVWARTPRESNAPITVQTPSAAAAIRGTDWVLSIDADNVTSVLVYDGQVDLSNSQGSITAASGSGASAARGGVPRSVQVFNLAERQQMLFSVTPGAAANAIIQFERAANGETPEPVAYRDGIGLLRAGRLQEAAALLERSAPGFDPQRASAARWIAAFARAGGGAPIRNQARGGGAVDRFADAYLSAYRGDLAKAAAGLETVHDSPVALAEAVKFAVYLDRFDEARRLLAQLQTVAPDTHQALSAEAFVKTIIDGNPSTAVILYRRAVVLDSQDPTLLSDLAMAEHRVGHPVEAEAALRRALTLAPGDTDILANLVVVLLDQYRVAEAGDIVDQLIQSAPGAFPTLAARAQVDASRTDNVAAEASALQALSAQPGAAENSILLAIAAHRAGDDVRAQQELDAAARLDPNNPNIPAIRGTIALDNARADEAIIAALEAERLFRQNLAADLLSADRKSGSILTSAFQNIGLTDWARDIGDRSHDPLSAASLFSEALNPRPTIAFEDLSSDPSDSFIPSSELQGLLLDPLGAVGRLRHSDITRKPFLDAEISMTVDPDNSNHRFHAGTLTGFTTAPVPLGFYFDGAIENDGDTSDLDRVSFEDSTLLVVAEPGARLGLMAFRSAGTEEDGLNVSVFEEEENDFSKTNFSFSGLGASYRLRERSILSFYMSKFDLDQVSTTEEIDPDFDNFATGERLDVSRNTDFYALGYRGDGARGTWFAGYEFQDDTINVRTDTFTFDDQGAKFEFEPTIVTLGQRGSRAYVQRRQDFGGRFELKGDFGVYHTNVKASGTRPWSPRVGLGATLAPGHRIRIAGIRDVWLGEESLAPSTTLGLFPIGAPLDPGGSTVAGIFRYDGTISNRFHLSLEHQSLKYTKLSFDAGDIETDVDEARMHRTDLRSNLWLGGGVGAFASVAVTNSKVRSGAGQGFGIIGVPEREAAVGLTWVHPSQLRISAQARHIGERVGNVDGTVLDPVWTVDASLAWEPFDKRLKLAVDARNLFNADFQSNFDQGSAGRSIAITAAMRF